MSKPKNSAMNIIFVSFILTAILYAAANGTLKEVTDASFENAKNAVTLAFSLIGIMALWLGLVRILEAGGLMFSLANFIRPIVVKLFPDVPVKHPAMSAMLLNISANALGLGNAATPLGLKAMTELNKLNPCKGTATNAMCLFLAINTSGLTLLPLGVIGLRAAVGATTPASIFLPTLIATTISTITAIVIASFLACRDKQYLNDFKQGSVKIAAADSATDEAIEEDCNHFSQFRDEPTKGNIVFGYGVILAFAAVFICRSFTLKTSMSFYNFMLNEVLSIWLLPALILLILAYGLIHGVKIYEAVTDGAKQGFEIAIKIIPFLVAILVAIGMFRASGAMMILVKFIEPYTACFGLPAEVIPVAILRPLSGTGAFAAMSEIVSHAPNSYESFVASILMGCTETTFYVMAVYFGSIGVVKVRHALTAGLCADVVGIVAASITAMIFW